MRKNVVQACLLTLALIIAPTCQESKSVPESGKVEVQLQSPFWNFETSSPACSQLSRSVAQSDLSLPEDLTQGFTIRFRADLQSPEGTRTLLEIPRVLQVTLRQHDPSDRKMQNYPAYKMPDGSVPVLEASLSLESPTRAGEFQDLVIGIPLAILERPEGAHDITLQFSGVSWSLYVDGRLYDNDFALGYPLASRMKSWSLNPDIVSDAALYEPALQPERIVAPEPFVDSNIQYWTPPYHNAWVGDVVTFFHEGRYHVFYLFDRRGHASKFGKGGHYFEHLSTTDFRVWTEHEAATPLEHQWETFGTGTPFLYDGKLCISYGLHTTRIYPKEQTTLPMQWDYLDKHGYTASIDYDTIRSLVPAGSTYSVSEDGVHFKKTHVVYHPCENPSIYIDPDGRLKMLANYGARGTWGADSVAGGWICLNADFPLGGDCTFFFRWGGYDYIIGGFTRLWSKPAAESESAYKDIVAEGKDFYNGLSVPAITEIPGGRFLMAGWLKMQNWGGPLVIHELVQLPDGYVGTKWMEEITPATGASRKLSDELSGNETFPVSDRSFLLSFEVCPDQPRQGRVAVSFLPEEGAGEKACEWKLCLDKSRAQYAKALADGFAPEEKTLREGGAPQSAGDYAIENGMNTSEPFTVRILVDGVDKFGGALIDTEIGAQRTMITYRPELSVAGLSFRMEGVSVKNIRIAPLCD